MSWVRVDERGRITEMSEEEMGGMVWTDTDMEGWTILDNGVPVYKMTEGGKVARRTDQEIRKDKKGKG